MDNRDVVHVRGRTHDNGVFARQPELGTDAIVIRLHPSFGDDSMPIGVRGALAALMIHQPADVRNPPSVASGRADHMVSSVELRDEKPAGSA